MGHQPHRRRRTISSTPLPRGAANSSAGYGPILAWGVLRGLHSVLAYGLWGGETLFDWNAKLWEHNLDNGPRPLRLAVETHLITIWSGFAEGKTNRQIAAELFISSDTAGVHVSRILAKLGVSTRTEAAAITHRRNLFTRT
jgi:hypothetical protein